MQDIKCNKCNNIIHIDISKTGDKVFCSYCANELDIAFLKTQNSQDAKVKNLVEEALMQKDPLDIYNKLIELDKNHENNLSIKRALLMQGNLHLRNKKNADFSVIHSYMLNIFLEPDIFRSKKRAEMISKLVSDKNLIDCLNLINNKSQFLQNYYCDISEDFIHLFLKGSNKYMGNFFGFGFGKKASKNLAYPCRKILYNILNSEDISPNYRRTLAKAFYTAFGKQLNNEYQYLDAELDSSIYAIVKADYPDMDFEACNETKKA